MLSNCLISLGRFLQKASHNDYSALRASPFSTWLGNHVESLKYKLKGKRFSFYHSIAYYYHKIRKYRLGLELKYSKILHEKSITKLFESGELDKINLILISPHGRSGSLFIQSLFDSHEEIAGFPSLSYDYDHPSSIKDWKRTLIELCTSNVELFDMSKGYLNLDRSCVTSDI